MDQDHQQNYVLRTIEERRVRLVRLWFTDVLGQLKSVAISPVELESAFDEGIQFDGSAIDGFSRIQESDVLARPGSPAGLGYPARGIRIGSTTGYTRPIMERLVPLAARQGFAPEVMVCAGDAVTAGQPLMVLEAMKMEMTIRAPRDGKLADVTIQSGQQVRMGVVLAELEVCAEVEA